MFEIEIRGAVIRGVDVAGPGPARVYLHGLGGASTPYYTDVVAHPLLRDRRSLLVDLPGHGLSDPIADFDYTMESHADVVAEVLRHCGITGADLVAHSMGGAVALMLVHRHPDLVARLVLVDANLDPTAPDLDGVGSGMMRAQSEAEFLAGGRTVMADRDPSWWATMRWADPVGLYRSGVALARGTAPMMRDLLCALDLPRTFLVPGDDGPPPHPEQLTAAGVRLVTVPDSGHCIMLDNLDGFAAAVADATD